MANQVQNFTATNATSAIVVRCHRAGYVSEDVVLNLTMTVAQIKAAFEALTMFTAVTPSAAINAGNGASSVTFTNPAHERLWFDLIGGPSGWTTSSDVNGASLAELMGKPTIDQITSSTARLTPPVGGKPTGVNSANLRIRSKLPGDLDSAFSAWSNAITGINFAAPAVFNVPEGKVIDSEFEIL